MSDLKFAGIIPARFASTRFPGKPLALIGGKTMIQRVYEKASSVLKHVYVATDDERIANAVKEFGGNVIITSPNHQSGTDRCYEALCNTGEKFDVVINIQGDEPFIDPSQIKALMDCFDDSQTQIATMAKKISPKDGMAYLENPNHPKLVVNSKDEAMYFSRSVIPYLRGTDKNEWLSKHVYLKHLGIYAYRADILAQITSLTPSTLELAESLEQLRWLENGFRIKICYTDIETIGIDTPEDLEKANLLL
ncbi:MAG: 3-deoxy-manno-octulosonate cytidylyltransferase [Bacteroidia bacterium]|nr:3-deoxy-manno-octulosonate cytidylyltransferase [Bacteroidia bacterium]